MNQRRLILGLLSVCTALTVAACSIRTEDQALTASIESNLRQMVSDPVLLTADNPNDYIAGNREAYDDILNTGRQDCLSCYSVLNPVRIMVSRNGSWLRQVLKCSESLTL